MALTQEEINRLRELHAKYSVQTPPAQTGAAVGQEKTSGEKTSGGVGSTLANLGVGVAKSAGGLALGLGTFGQKILNAPYKAVGAQGREVPIYTKGTAERAAVESALKTRGTAQGIGKFAGDVAQFAIPGGAVAKATKGAGMLTRLGARTATAGGVATAQEGEIGKETAIAVATEAVLPIAGKTAAGLTKYGAGVLKGLAGTLTGAGEEALERVIQNPNAALTGIRGGDEGLKQLATQTRKGIKNIMAKTGKEYETLTSGVTKTIDKTKVQKMVTNILTEEADATISKKGIQFVDTPFTSVEEGQLAKVYNVVNGWSDYSAKGVNELARRISRFRRGTKDAKNFDRIIDDMRRNVRNIVGEEVPEIAEANAKYADKMDLLEQVDAVLKTSGKFDSRKGVMETSQKIAQLFNANKSGARGAVEELEKELGIDILATEAGRRFSGGPTQFQIGASDTVMNFVRSVVPKSFIGKTAARIGQSKEFVEQRLVDKLEKLDPTSRAFVVEFMTEVLAPEEVQETPQE